MITEKTKQALKNIGYEVIEDRGYSGELTLQWRVYHELDDDWSNNGMAREACRKTEDEARQACLDHLKANAEAMCSRMMAAVARKSRLIARDIGLRIANGEVPHEVALNFFQTICCDVEDA